MKHLWLFIAGACAGRAQDNEVALTLGRVGGPAQTAGATRLEPGAGIALQANYGRTFWRAPAVAVQFEVHFLASPLREVASNNRNVTRDFATLFVTPGIRFKFLPSRRLSPWLAAGGGYALYEQSTTTLAGAPSPAPRLQSTGAFQYGGGADMKLWKWLGIRADVRDFYTGKPVYNAPVAGGQHNVIAGGGVWLRF